MTLIDTRTPNPKSFIKGQTGDWEVIIGMEVHAQVTSESKLFSGSSTEFGRPANSNVSFVDAAMPGMLPVINEECVRQAVRTGLGLNAAINNRPIVGEGKVLLDMPEGQIEIGIERLHLEQDAGKSIHDQHPNMSFVDLNRSGVALMEIVSKPDLRSSEEAKEYLGKLRTILRYLGTCDGNMEQGSMRADVNVSVRRPGGEFGTRCEIKNVNSIRFAGQAIEYEARRQIDILEDGGTIDQETRLFDPKNGETRSMRSKEEAHDYRYFPDPDLLPLEFDDAFIAELARHLPELPDEKKARFVKEYGVTAYDAMVLTLERETADYYEAAVKFGDVKRDGKAVANWISGDIAAYANSQGLSAWETHIKPGQVAGIVDLVAAGTISGKIAKDLLQIIIAEEPEGEPAAIVERRGMKQVTDLGAIEKVVDEIIAANPDQVAKVLAKPTLIGWFVGQAMKASGGKANPQALNEILKKKLGLE
jgi:aspartyl-tRNA(Asn)/glutamyl-tRNA(Gln) amidotransferase subunit B